jgi:type II secretory pathway pseudopilin PulG
VELLLTVALILLLAGAAILSFGQMDRNARLEEGAIQVETLFRFARAQAANTGRQVRIVFNAAMPPGGASNAPPAQAQTLMSTNTGVQALWEPDPINFPGKLEPLPGAALLVEHVNDLVQVLLTRQLGADEHQTNGALTDAMLLQLQTTGANSMTEADDGINPMPPVLCYPDGSSDSVGLVLGAVDREDKRFMVVTLSGLTGRLRHRLVAFGSDGTLMTNSAAPSAEMSATNSLDQ